jgi:glycosyltransferase involved in cell wall biosynthesis
MPLIISHPTGNANVRAVASGILEEKMLFEFNTSIASFPGGIIDQLGAIGPLSEIRRRRFQRELSPYTRVSPWREMGRLAAMKSGLSGLLKHETGLFCIDAVYRGLDKVVASRLKKSAVHGAKGIYAYEDGAETSFLEAKKHGIQCFYDLPTGYWRASRKLLETERERWPEWISTMTGFNDSPEKLFRKDEEIRLADRIFVASRFVADTLAEYPGTLPPIEIIPYGFPPVATGEAKPRRISGHPLKVLFVGKMTQQKGIADLFKVAEKLGPHIKLTLVGNKATEECAALNRELARHKWIPSLPHHKVLQLMREHDVLVFPSLFDGFGMVITEAMSQGTPVITTNRTGGPDFIDHGKNGWIVDAGSTISLQAAVEHCLEFPKEIVEAGREAEETAKRRPWKVYQQELSGVIRNHLGLN